MFYPRPIPYYPLDVSPYEATQWIKQNVWRFSMPQLLDYYDWSRRDYYEPAGYPSTPDLHQSMQREIEFRLDYQRGPILRITRIGVRQHVHCIARNRRRGFAV